MGFAGDAHRLRRCPRSRLRPKRQHVCTPVLRLCSFKTLIVPSRHTVCDCLEVSRTFTRSRIVWRCLECCVQVFFRGPDVCPINHRAQPRKKNGWCRERRKGSSLSRPTCTRRLARPLQILLDPSRLARKFHLQGLDRIRVHTPGPPPQVREPDGNHGGLRGVLHSSRRTRRGASGPSANKHH